MPIPYTNSAVPLHHLCPTDLPTENHHDTRILLFGSSIATSISEIQSMFAHKWYVSFYNIVTIIYGKNSIYFSYKYIILNDIFALYSIYHVTLSKCVTSYYFITTIRNTNNNIMNII